MSLPSSSLVTSSSLFFSIIPLFLLRSLIALNPPPRSSNLIPNIPDNFKYCSTDTKSNSEISDGNSSNCNSGISSGPNSGSNSSHIGIVDPIPNPLTIPPSLSSPSSPPLPSPPINGPPSIPGTVPKYFRE